MSFLRSLNYLSLDLEINLGSIIQVGVAVGNPVQDSYSVHSWYIKPLNGLQIEPRIADLTGITQPDIDGEGIDHRELAENLSALAEGCFVNPVQWGHADAALLLGEFAQTGTPFPYFGRRTIDVKTIYAYLEMAAGRSPSGGLKAALSRHGIRAEGRAHDAGADAANTLRLYFHLLRRQARINELACEVGKWSSN